MATRRAAGDRERGEGERARVRHASYELARRFVQLPPFDIADPQQMWDRCMLILDTCDEVDLMPTLGAFAMGLGTSLDILRRIREGGTMGWRKQRLSAESSEVLANFLMLFEGVFDANFENGAYSQPVAGIFASKNNYGWKDTRETHEVVAHVEVTPEQIAARYQASLPAHQDVNGEVHLLQEGISSSAMARTAEMLRQRADEGRYEDFSAN